MEEKEKIWEWARGLDPIQLVLEQKELLERLKAVSREIVLRWNG